MGDAVNEVINGVVVVTDWLKTKKKMMKWKWREELLSEV